MVGQYRSSDCVFISQSQLLIMPIPKRPSWECLPSDEEERGREPLKMGYLLTTECQKGILDIFKKHDKVGTYAHSYFILLWVYSSTSTYEVTENTLS